MIVVADTSPINYLVLIREIDILPAMYDKVLIPRAVFEELSHASAPELLRSWISACPSWLEVRTPLGSHLTSKVLDIGEAQAIELAREVMAERILIDDRRGREEAERVGLSTIGTLGLVRDAATVGLLDLKATVQRLVETNFYIDAHTIRLLLGS